ncbi:MAG: hypothetical protein LBB18_01035 [Puniceicoccales bacterium]|jgi:hypothetical protein|nr:hypothetical protein [Puniceicoccales bacterium]
MDIKSQILSLRNEAKKLNRECSVIWQGNKITAKPIGSWIFKHTEISIDPVSPGSRGCKTLPEFNQKYTFTYNKGRKIEEHIGFFTAKMRANKELETQLSPLISSITTPGEYARGKHGTKQVANPAQIVAAINSSGAFKELREQKSEIITVGTFGNYFDMLAKIPAFKALFNGSTVLTHALSGDPMTVGDHTKQVLGQFYSQREFFNIEKAAASIEGTPGFENFNANAFMEALITVHDIGKSIGRDATDQHKFTVPILSETMAALGFSEKEINLAEQLVDNDILGDLQKDPNGDPAHALNQLRDRAAAAGIPIDTFFLLQKALYVSDASSYPAVRNGVMWQSHTTGQLFFDCDKLIEIDKLIITSAAKIEIAKCTPKQQKFINMYMNQMTVDGDRPEWILSVAHDMAKLYQGGIEKTLLAPNGQRYGVNDSDEFLNYVGWMGWRMETEAHLQKLMHEMGGSLKLIHDWQNEQICDSFSPFSCAMKSIMLDNRRDGNDAWNPQERYFTQGNTSESLRYWRQWTADKYGQNDGILQRSLSIYKAFTAIGLNSIDHPLIDRTTGMCYVVRGLFQPNMPSAFQNAKIGDVITDQTNGIAESTSLHATGPEFFSEPKYGNMVVQMDVPFSRVCNAFFLSTQFAERNPYRYQCEIVADISNLPMLVTSTSVPRNQIIQQCPGPLSGTPLGLIKRTNVSISIPGELKKY